MKNTLKAIFVMLAMLAGSALAATVTFTASGNWTAPVGVTSAIVEAWGGGGAGGGATANPAKGGGGAGGQYARRVVTVVPGNNYAVVVGAAGMVSTGNGSAGGDSTFAATSVVAKGGAGGTGATNGVAGVGSTAGGVADLVYAGGSGAAGEVDTNCNSSGSGGGGAGSGGTGGNAAGNTGGVGTATGGGDGGAGSNSSGNGQAGNVAGGGGAGACAEGGTDRNGGAGARGQVVITYSLPPTVTSINRASANPTSAATAVAWTVVFSESVTGVTIDDFALVQAGGVAGATITSVTGSGTTWTVNADTGTGSGTLGLNLDDDDSIVSGGLPLGGTGFGNGNFTGQVYNVSPPFCSPPSNIPAGVAVSCVCDTFGRASLNPSTIFGGNWALSNSDGIGNAYINATTGLLRLTENTNNNAKAATVPSIFPAAGNFISVEFMHYAYRGGNPGADGVAVTLSDYSVPAVPGGFGGSLGYAQRNDGINPPGFAGGWVGVALDEYGNYQNPTEGRVGGAGFISQSVGVRGPGNGANGYRWMGGTASNPGGYSISANSTSTTPAPGYMYQVIVDARNYASGTVNVSVNRDATTRNGSTYSSLFGPFNAYSEANYALTQGWITQLVPDYWKISFTGSTGGSTNIHEIGSLRICAQTVYPPTGGTASGFSAIDEAYPGAPTVPAYPNFQTGHIYMKQTGSSFRLWAAALTSTAISTGYSATSSKYVQVKLVDNSDNACGSDAARTCDTTCTNKTAVETGATQIATFVSGSSTGVASPSPTFTLNSSYKNLIAVMKECTTSTCAAFTATTPACSADSFSVRPLSIASVASIDTPTGTGNAATNTGASGTPIFRASSGYFALTATTTGIAGYPSKYTGVMKINSAVLQANSPATVAGVVTGSFPAATSATPSSAAIGTAFTYSEVGGFVLPGFDPASDTTSRRGVYDGVDTTNECTVPGLTATQCDLLRAATWTGIDSISTEGDCVADSYSNTRNAAGKYGCNFGLLRNPVAPNRWAFGRFVPDHFDTVVMLISGVPMTCPTNTPGLTCPALYNGFVYSGQPAGWGQPFTVNVYARNGAGGSTLNYDSTMGLSKAVTLSAWDTRGGAIANANGTLNDNIVAASAFSSGSTVLGTPATPDFTFTTMPTAPADIYLRAVDADGVTSLRGVSSIEGGVKVLSGRVRVSNAYGSELLPLTLTATAQYYNATGWANSITDDVTSLTLAATYNVVKNGVTTGTTTPAPTGATTLTAGKRNIVLAKPTGGATGTATISPTKPDWLQLIDGSASFGVYKSGNRFIYRREN